MLLMPIFELIGFNHYQCTWDVPDHIATICRDATAAAQRGGRNPHAAAGARRTSRRDRAIANALQREGTEWTGAE